MAPIVREKVNLVFGSLAGGRLPTAGLEGYPLQGQGTAGAPDHREALWLIVKKTRLDVATAAFVDGGVC